MARETGAEQGKPEAEGPADAPPQIDSRSLFGKARVLTIRHGDGIYTLRITRAEKLILTK